MDYIVFSNERYREKRVSKTLFNTLAKYCTTDNINSDYNFQLESDDIITIYYWQSDGRPMGFILGSRY